LPSVNEGVRTLTRINLRATKNWIWERKFIVLACAIIIIILFWYQWINVWRHNFGPEGQARKLVYADLNHNWHSIYANTLHEESKFINPDQACDIFNWIVWPTFKGFRIIGAIRSAEYPSGAQAVAEIDLANKDGKIYTANILLTVTDDGYRCSLLSQLFYTWIFKYLIAKNLPINGQNVCRADLQGYRDDKYIFDQIGLMGLPKDDGTHLVLWSHLIHRWQVGASGPHALADEDEQGVD